jgi:hypothetical protein
VSSSPDERPQEETGGEFPAEGVTNDLGLAFLQRAAARLELVEAGEMEIEEAVVGLIGPLEELIGPLLCDCSYEIIERWDRDYPPTRRKRYASYEPR